MKIVLEDIKRLAGSSFRILVNPKLKIDFLGREIIVSPFIASALRRLKKQNEIEEYKNINVLVYKTKEDSKIPNLYFFNSTKPIKPISLDFIFGEEIE